MKICAYVQEAYAKANYKNECMNTRLFYGLRVIIDSLIRNGYEVDFAGIATVHQYDVVLVSLTGSCDWFPFIRERIRWKNGKYKVVCGGAACLHVSPFLEFCDFFVLGRGEKVVIELIKSIEKDISISSPHVINSGEFSAEKRYTIAQTEPYCHAVQMEKQKFEERTIGCNHKCYFCGYTWHRKLHSCHGEYTIADNSFFGSKKDREQAILDIAKKGMGPNMSELMTTAIDGFSGRLRFMVNKKISDELLKDFFVSVIESPAKPRILKVYNICGYPTETYDDWDVFLETAISADKEARRNSKKWGINLHTTPFKPMPATPMACAPISKKNYRGSISRYFTRKNTRNIAELSNMYIVESIGTESLATMMLEAIVLRGERHDAENIKKICTSKKFWASSSAVKEATLCRYFNMDRLFGAFTAETLPSRYLRTYAAVEKFWRAPFWERLA